MPRTPISPSKLLVSASAGRSTPPPAKAIFQAAILTLPLPRSSLERLSLSKQHEPELLTPGPSRKELRSKSLTELASLGRQQDSQLQRRRSGPKSLTELPSLGRQQDGQLQDPRPGQSLNGLGARQEQHTASLTQTSLATLLLQQQQQQHTASLTQTNLATLLLQQQQQHTASLTQTNLASLRRQHRRQQQQQPSLPRTTLVASLLSLRRQQQQQRQQQHRHLSSLRQQHQQLRRLFFDIRGRAFATIPMSLAKAREVLGVERGVTEVELKSAFRARALEFHPDRNEEEGAETKFLESRLAFEALLPTLGGKGTQASGFTASTSSSSSSSAHPFWRPTSSAWQTWSGEADSSAYAGWRQRPPNPWGENEHPRDWQEREIKERKRKHQEQMKAEAERSEKWAQERARRLGLKRGMLLVAKPDTRGFFTMSVVLLMEIDGSSARGIVINGGPGGRTGLQDHAVFHSCRNLASEPDLPVVEGVELFVEEYLQKYEARDLVDQLAGLEEPLARTQGYTWWSLEQLVKEVEAGQWKTAAWGTAGARWWLKVRSKLTTRTLWRRALRQAEEQQQKKP